MKILQRLKNLWKLSEFEIKDGTQKLEINHTTGYLQRPQQAKVIKREDIIEDFLKTI